MYKNMVKIIKYLENLYIIFNKCEVLINFENLAMFKSIFRKLFRKF